MTAVNLAFSLCTRIVRTPINYSCAVSSKCHVLVHTVVIFLSVFFISLYTKFFPSFAPTKRLNAQHLVEY